MRPQQPLLAARENSGLSQEEMASLVGLPVIEVATLEAGARYVSPDVVERYALVLGMSAREVLMGHEPSAVGLLFRRIRQDSGALASWETHRALGDFVRCARNYSGLRKLLGEGPDQEQLRWLDDIDPEPLAQRPELYAQARRLASRVRAYLGLGPLAVIESMRRLVEELGIVTMFIQPEQLDPHIEGASLLNPHPAILVNLVGGGEQWWRTRMVMAHELCHIVFDRTALNPDNPRKFFVFSPYRSESSPGTSWHLFEHFEDLEARANAFAGDFLAPTSGVEHILGGADPTTLAAISRISDHYQIGNETAINRLQNTFRLSREQRSQMFARLAVARATGARRSTRADPHGDDVAPGAQLRDTAFIGAVVRACQLGKIDAMEARAYLNLRLSDSLPSLNQAAPSIQQGPVVSSESRVLRAAERHLYRCASLDHFVRSFEHIGGVWHIYVDRHTPEGTSVQAGAFRMSPDLSLLDPLALQQA
jgi:transcriptional regulator with XRE-family HTH domain